MAELIHWEPGEASDLLFIHFDVPDHFLKLETFVQTAESAQRVVKALDGTFFGGQLNYELVVLPPKEGTFLTRLAIWVLGVPAAAAAFFDTSFGTAYVEGLTGHPPSYWGTAAANATLKVADELRDLIEDDDDDHADEEAPVSDDEAVCRQTARITVEMTRAILESTPEHLKRVGMEIGELPDALDARADFYLACIEDREVQRVGFTPSNEFPIPRNAFPERAIKPERRELDEAPPEWVVSTESIYVTSPNWDEEDQNARKWKGKDQARRDCYFVVEDKEFWQLARRKTLHVEVLDNLKVQWAYKLDAGKPKDRRVLRVLELNGEKLAEPLTPDAISAILGDYSAVEAARGHPDLFGDE